MNVADRFCRFFADANDGKRPYPWQLALLERVAATGRWPAAITAPTGSGKSSVIDIHVFLVAERSRLAAIADDCTAVHRPPRRLVLIAPRRVLVDDQHLRAVRLAKLLADAPEDTDLGEAHRALARLTTSKQDDEGRSLGVARLRGGVRLDRSWRLDPGQCQVICATPEMWGSRLLLRGFRASRRSRNLESGLLCEDVAVVIDEAHLHTRLLDTARRIAVECSSPSRLQIVGMTATPARVTSSALAADTVGLTADDDTDEELVRRIDAEKRVSVDRIEDWSRGRGSCVAETARAVRAARSKSGTVGVFVNTVASALDVAARLRDAEPEQVVRIVCGRMRPADLALLRTEHPGLLDHTGDPSVAFLVSTQSLEVGVDLDLDAIVSELAPASALAQRLGRLNRSGTRRDATFVVLAPRDDAIQELGPRLLPYRAEQMRDALAWLEALGADGSPRNVSQTPLPQDDSVPLPAITSAELTTLAMTSVVLAADPEVEFYIADPIEREQDRVQIAARDHLGDLPADVIRRALLAAPPRAHELASVPARLPLPDEALRQGWILRSEAGRLRAHQVRETGTDFLDGDVLVIPAGSPVLTERIVGTPGARRGDPMNDAMEVVAVGEPDRVVRIDGRDAALVAGLEEGDRVLGTRQSRNELAGILDGAGMSGAADRLRRHRYLSELSVTWCGAEESDTGLLVIVEREGQEARRMVSSKPVTVDAHNAEVAQRMSEIIASLDGVVVQERDDLLVAASLHDSGKRHPCFQRRMGAQPDGPALAKPALGHKPDQGDGWRHEQLSAAWARAEGAGSLTQIVIAAHHGAGRPMFDDDDVAAQRKWETCPDGVAVALVELFGPYGAFERERDVLHRELGVHRSAFLEALLRCADMQISSEVTD